MSLTVCKMHDDCLTCPLPECIYVTGKVYAKVEQRHDEIRKRALKEAADG